jgi:hypothetical protein
MMFNDFNDDDAYGSDPYDYVPEFDDANFDDDLPAQDGCGLEPDPDDYYEGYDGDGDDGRYDDDPNPYHGDYAEDDGY